MRSSTTVQASAAALAVLLVASLGCSSSSSPAATTVPDTTTTTAGQGGSGGSGGSTGSGGSGGSTGVGGAGGQGGAGGAPCIAEEGTGKTAIDGCGALSGAAHVCGPDKNQPPPPTLACFAGFSVLSAGAAEALATCLLAIPEASLCDAAATKACRDDVFARVCEVPAVEGACKNVDETFCAGGDGVDVAACVARMRAFSNQALVDVVGCVQAAGVSDAGTCQSVLDGCIDARASGL